MVNINKISFFLIGVAEGDTEEEEGYFIDIHHAKAWC